MTELSSPRILSTLPQGPSHMSVVEFSLDPDGQTAQLRCPEEAHLSLVNLASAYNLTEVRRYKTKGYKALIVEGQPEDFYKLWRRCAPSNLQAREQHTRDLLLDAVEQHLTKRGKALLG